MGWFSRFHREIARIGLRSSLNPPVAFMPEMPSDNHVTPRPSASVVDLAFALWAFLIPMLLHGRLLNGDGDLARHLVLGKHILRAGPRFQDVFSFTRAGDPFLAYEWLSQVTLHLVNAAGGLPFVAVFSGMILATTLAMVVVYVRRKGGDPWLAFMTGALAAVLTGPHWIARPHLFTLLALPCLLLLLDRERFRLPGIAALFAVWANLHPGFLYGLVILFVIMVGRVLEGRLSGSLSPRDVVRSLSVVLVAIGASMMNPFGWNLHAHIIHHARDMQLSALVDEFQPLDLFSGYGILILGLVSVVALGLSVQRKRVPLDALGVFLLGFFAALAARRHGPLLGVAGLPMMARALTPAVSELPEWFAGKMRRVFRESDGRSKSASLGVLAVLGLVVVLRGHIGGLVLIPNRFSADDFPVEAVDQARSAGLTGNLLSEYTWGGYVLYSWPEQRIFVDSMADFFGPELIYDYLMMRDAGPEWRRYLLAWDISLVLLSPEAPLSHELLAEPGWELWHTDATAVLFRRESATN